ncbi:MAG: hypothetical protein R2752_22600, partial [Vicinamibacterales bacterium]
MTNRPAPERRRISRVVPAVLLAATAMAACGRAGAMDARAAQDATPPQDAAASQDAAGRQDAGILQTARAAIVILESAGTDGLDPADYDVAGLRARADALAAAPAPDPTQAEALDAAVSHAMTRFLEDLHSGRVDPRTLGFRLTPAPERHDVPALVRGAIANGRLPDLVARLRPSLDQYG